MPPKKNQPIKDGSERGSVSPIDEPSIKSRQHLLRGVLTTHAALTDNWHVTTDTNGRVRGVDGCPRCRRPSLVREITGLVSEGAVWVVVLVVTEGAVEALVWSARPVVEVEVLVWRTRPVVVSEDTVEVLVWSATETSGGGRGTGLVRQISGGGPGTGLVRQISGGGPGTGLVRQTSGGGPGTGLVRQTSGGVGGRGRGNGL